MAKKTRTVVLYGSSLLMAGLAASLEAQPHLSLHRLTGSEPELSRQLAALRPDVLIFDLAAGRPDAALSLLRDQAQVLLIGVDLHRQEMLQWTGRHARALTIQDLVEAIESWTGSGGL